MEQQTPTNNDQPKQRKVPSQIEFREPGQWKIGEFVVTVMGGLPNEEKQPIGYVVLHGYGDDKKPILAARDLDGNELFERTANLYNLKKQFLGMEQQLTKEMLIRKNGKETPSAEITQEEKQPQVQKDAPETEKTDELKKVRAGGKSRNKDNEQHLTH